MGQVIGTVNVQVGPSAQPRVSAINYGRNTLASASDLNLTGVQNDDVIVYQSSTKSFVVAPVGSILTFVDGGTY